MTGDQNLRNVLKLFWTSNRRMLLGGMALSLATALAGIALLGLSGWFITATAIAGLSVTTALAFDVFSPSAGIRFFAMARTAGRYGERLATHQATFDVLAALREQLFRGWAVAGAARSLASRPARLLFRLTVDTDALDAVYLRLLAPVATALGAALVTTLALGLIDARLGLAVGLSLLVIGFGIPAIAAKHGAAQSRRRAYMLEVLRGRVIDLTRGQTDLLMMDQLGSQTAAINNADARLAGADDALNRIEANTGFGLAVLNSLLVAAVLVAVALLAEQDTVSAPVAAMAVLVALAAIEPFTALRRGAIELGRTLLAIKRIGSRLGEPATSAARHAPAQDNIAVELRDVSLVYPGTQSPTLQHINLTVRAGERIALIGSSGAGKSTLLALLANELTATTGQVHGRDIALLTQRTELFRDSLRDNLRLARPDASDRELHDALVTAGFDAVIATRTDGLDARLGEGGMGLSGGQARRLALARLLLRDAPVWLLDEPTDGLDGDTARDVLARLDKAARKRTVIIATHIRREAALADRLIWITNGSVGADIPSGTTEFNEALARLRPD